MKLTKYIKEGIVRSIMNDTPKPDTSQRNKQMQAALVKAMSPECRKVYLRTPEVFETSYCEYLYDGRTYDSRKYVLGDAPRELAEEWEQKFQQEDAERIKAQRQLEAAIMGCNTLKQLKTLLPEFDKYYPTEQQPTKNLPALANVVADLTKLGWPKK